MNRKETIERLREQLSNVNADINVTNKSLEELRKIQQQEEKNEPTLENYYKPLDEMKDYQMFTVSLMGIGAGYIAVKLL